MANGRSALEAQRLEANVAPFADDGDSAVLAFGAGRLALALTSGIAAWAVFPPARLPLAGALAPIAWVPLFLAVRSARPRRSLFLGWVAGATMTGLGFAFLVPAAIRQGGVSLPAAIALELALAAFLGLSVGLPFAIAAWLRRLLPAPVTAAVLLSVAELLFPAPIPWSFGAALVDGPLVHLASIVGAPGLSLAAYASAASIAAILASSAPRRRRAGWLGAWCVAVAAVTLWGWARHRDLTAQSVESTRLAVEVLHLPSSAGEAERSGSQLFDRARTAAEHGAELVIAPETALAGIWPAEDLGPVATASWGPPRARVVAGVVVRQDGHFYNSAVLFESDGTVSGRYDKRALLPVAERIPGEDVFPFLRALSPRSGSFRAGGASAPAGLASGELGISICFEDVMALGHDPPERAEVLVNITNDSWFSGTTEPATHLALARLRAVESGRYLVRATAGGVTSVIDPSGDVTSRIEPDASGAIRASIPRLSDGPLRSRLGLLPYALACCALLGVAAAVSRFRSRASAPS